MKDIGAGWQIRKVATSLWGGCGGGEFSRLCHLGFERGENDLTNSTFFLALQQVGNQSQRVFPSCRDRSALLYPQIVERALAENMSLEHDQALYQSYQLAYQESYHKEEDLLASIILKAQNAWQLSWVVSYCQSRGTRFPHDYLFSVMI